MTCAYGTAAAEDAESCILAVQPAIVVLELDEKRYRKLMHSAASSDPFGVQRVVHGGVLKVTWRLSPDTQHCDET